MSPKLRFVVSLVGSLVIIGVSVALILSLILLLTSFFPLSKSSSNSSATKIGVNYIPSPQLPSNKDVISVLKSHNINFVRLPLTTPNTIHAFSNTGIDLFLTIPNNLVFAMAYDRNTALAWIQTNVKPYYPHSRITAISVGGYYGNFNFAINLVNAIQNVCHCLMRLGIYGITVSTTLSFDHILPITTYNIHQLTFIPEASVVLKPLLEHLNKTKAPLFLNFNLYTFYRLSPEMPIAFPLFVKHPDSKYLNLYHLMLESVYSALRYYGYHHIPIVVTQIGWPCSDSSNNVEASTINSQIFLQGLINHLSSTTSQKHHVKELYLYSLFDIQSKNKHLTTDRFGEDWGFLNANGTSKFRLKFSNAKTPVKNQYKWEMLIVVITFALLVLFTPITMKFVDGTRGLVPKPHSVM